MPARPGDKVRLKTERHLGSRGVVERIENGVLVIRSETSGEIVRAAAEAVTNFSLAARKAWKSMPDRGVGRPKGTRLCDRVSVTLRIDRDLWKQFQADEERGLIEDRTATINVWLREKLDALQSVERRA